MGDHPPPPDRKLERELFRERRNVAGMFAALGLATTIWAVAAPNHLALAPALFFGVAAYLAISVTKETGRFAADARVRQWSEPYLYRLTRTLSRRQSRRMKDKKRYVPPKLTQLAADDPRVLKFRRTDAPSA